MGLSLDMAGSVWGKVPWERALFNASLEVLRCLMKNATEATGRQPRAALIIASVIGALLLGAALAGWLDHGAEIFLTAAADAWAYCF
jgi:hypothetical protein